MSTPDVTASTSHRSAFSIYQLSVSLLHLHHFFNNPTIPSRSAPIEYELKMPVRLTAFLFIMIQYFIASATILEIQDIQLNTTPYISTTHSLSQRLKWASVYHEWTRNSETVCEGIPNSILYWALSASGRERLRRRCGAGYGGLETSSQ